MFLVFLLFLMFLVFIGFLVAEAPVGLLGRRHPAQREQYGFRQHRQCHGGLDLTQGSAVRLDQVEVVHGLSGRQPGVGEQMPAVTGYPNLFMAATADTSIR